MEKSRPQFENQDSIIEDQNYSRIKPEVIEDVVGRQGTQRAIFDRNYHETNNFINKYRLARDLILDGRFENPVVLLNNFIHPEAEIPAEQKNIVEPLKERLHFLLIQKGILSPASMTEETSKRLLRGELERRQTLKDLIDEGWPIEVVGQLMAVDLFTDITDNKKLEELRGWTTRGLYGEYLGVIKGKRSRAELTIVDIIDRIPKRIFSDPNGIKFHLVEHYIEQRLMRSITDAGVQEGLASLDVLVEGTDDPDKKEFLQRLADRFYNIATEPHNHKFNTTVTLKGQVKPFPSFEQMACCYDFEHHRTRLVAAGTGLGKTGTFYKMMEKSDATRALVLTPAGAKATWEIEEKKLFRQPGDVFVVDNKYDLRRAVKLNKKYTVVSLELLSRAGHDPKLSALLDELVDKLGMDGAGIDEIDSLNNPRAISTQTAKRLLEKIRQNYAAKTAKSEYDVPIIGLTATPLRSRLSDLNVTMGLLYPEKYAISHGESTTTRKTFSDSHLNRPDLAYFTLIGEKRMFRWEQATGVQEFKYKTVPVKVSPFEEYLYIFIANEVPTDQLNKIRILEDCLFNPLLVKKEVTMLAKGKIPILDIDRTMRRLSRIVSEWKRIRNTNEPISQDDYLSADRLVELGLGDVVLACFFSDLLENGIDTLVEELTRDSKDTNLKDLRKFWRSRDISTKYRALREIIEDSLKWRIGDDGKPARQKVFIVSPSRKQGRTGDVFQREIADENGNGRNLYAQYELDTINDSKLAAHVGEWIKDCCPGQNVLLLDGDIGRVGKRRDEIIDRWVNDPNASILIVTLEATYQSRDYTLNVIEDALGRRIDGVMKIFLAPPWHFQQLKQMSGRSQRQGQLVPVDIKILESQDLIDHGKGEAVLYTDLLSRMALSGIVLTPDEQEFFDSKRVGNRIPLQSAESRFLRDALSWVRGAGESRLEDYLRRKSTFREEVTYDRLIAEKFFDNGKDEFHTTGYNAELVAYLARNFVGYNSRILSLGAGTLLLQRKLKRGIDNVDINPHMMEAGWALAGQYGGRKIVGKASSLPEEQIPSGSYDLVDSAFALNWSNIDTNEPGNIASSERVKILAQVNRTLKDNGVFILTIPENSFDEERFEVFSDTLEKHFGFQVDKEFSGKSFGRSKIGLVKRLGWCIVAKKVSNVDLGGFILDNLEFANERGEWISYGSKRKKGQSGGVQGKDYPTPTLELQFDQYEILNDKNEVTVISYQDDDVIPTIDIDEDEPRGEVIQTSEDGVSGIIEANGLGLDFLRGETKEDYREYRTTLIKPIMKITGKTWKEIDEVEALCLAVFKEVQERRGHVNKRLRAYSLIRREVERQTNKSRGEVNGNGRKRK